MTSLVPPSQPALFPAFKEWSVIIETLVAGEQIIILRKGGISEGRGGFAPRRAERFWLFPTRFHAQVEKTKPSAAARFTGFNPSQENSPCVTLRAFADVTHHAFLDDWSAVAALDRHHVWTADAVREKFEWSRPPGLHVFVVRVHRLAEPIRFALTPEMGGCKSWIELPHGFTAQPTAPVLADEEYARRVGSLPLSWPEA